MIFNLYLTSLCFLWPVTNAVADICLTCLCSATGDRPVINCYGQQLGNNDMLNFDLLMLNEHQTVDELILSKNSIIFLPRRLLSKLEALKSLDLSENLMEKIHPEVFSDLANLRTLRMSKNFLTTFDDSLLKTLPSLLTLDLSGNRIATIKHTTADSVELSFLDLSSNNIANLSSDSFASLANLRYLDLSFNKIQTLREDCLSNLRSLQELRINNNLLTALQISVFPKFLRRLDSGNNSITEIFYESSGIEVLNVDYNRIRKIETNITLFDRLQHLNVRGNVLSDFPSVTLARLETLDVSFNEFPKIPDALSANNFPALVKLDVSGNPMRDLNFPAELRLSSFVASYINSLETVDRDSFAKLKSQRGCVNVNLSNNEKLSFVHEKALERTELCSLDLSNNRIGYLSSELTRSNASFNFQGNPFNCNCSLQWMLDDLVPRLYSARPDLLDDLRCALPRHLSNTRMVHWYGWREKIFCVDARHFVENLSIASPSSSKIVVFESSRGLIIVLITTISLFAVLIITGLLLTQKLYRKRSRANRRF